MLKKKKIDQTQFEHTEVDRTLLKNCPSFDINTMYERVFEELALQQTKRDQLITIYLAAFAFIVPSLLSNPSINWLVTGSIFTVLGMIGWLFALIIIRYRKYKEVYWICCRTINVMMDMDKTEWKKENIQAIFYECLYKKIKRYIKDNKSKKGNEKKFKTFSFVKDNLFSGETLYLVIHSIIASCVFGLGIGMVLPCTLSMKVLCGIIFGVLLFSYCVFMYFKTLKKIYNVCVDGLNSSFNSTFGDAWFLHFFI